MATAGVDFFRIDRSTATKRLLAAGIVMVAAGASSVGAHLIRRLPASTSHIVSLIGGVTMLAGLVLAFGALAMMLLEDVYLTIEDGGLLLHDNGRETRIPWDELTEVTTSSRSGFVELCRKDKDVVHWYAGKIAGEVANRIREAKRKAAHGLFRSSMAPSHVT